MAEIKSHTAVKSVRRSALRLFRMNWDKKSRLKFASHVGVDGCRSKLKSLITTGWT